LTAPSAGSFHRFAQVNLAFAMRLRRAHHPDLAIELLREKSGAEIVAAHVRGQHDGAFRGGELLEKFGAGNFVGEVFPVQPEMRGLR
jgi:hypothetical protein